jgi:hypothetical protein
MTTFPNELRSFATVRQLEILDAIEKEGSERKAANALGLSRGTVSNCVAKVKTKAAKQGYAPEADMVHTVPAPFVVRGTSTLYRDGVAKLQWVKTRLDDEAYQRMLADAVEGFKDELPKELPVPLTHESNLNENLLNCYVITDFHLGMLAWGEETGANWDIKIAEDMLVKWFAQAIQQSPNAKTAVFAQMSDFLHFDGMDAVTPASKHLLDVDSRFAKLVRVAIRVLRTVIKMLLVKHEFVHIKMLDANHDPVSQIWLREWFSVIYEDEPRVTVDISPSPYNAYEFGNTALFFHHGHKKKVTAVSDVFVAKFREMYGRTKYAYAHTGHLHSIDVKENNLMIVEQHRTLAAPDAYSARGGWISGRDAKVITYSKEYGEVSRVTINSDMLK